MKKILFYTITLLAGLIIFFFVLREFGTQELVKTIFCLPAWKWATIIAVGLISFFIGVIRWRYIIKILTGKSISLKLATMAKAIGWTIAYITPIAYIGGEPHKIHLLKNQANIDWEPAGASVIIDEVLELSMALAFLILGVIFLLLKFSIPPILWLILVGGIGTCVILWLIFWQQTKNGKGAISFFIQLFNLHKIRWVNNIQEKIKEAEKQTSNFFHHHKTAFALALFLAFFERLILIITFWLIVVFLGSHVTIFQIMSIMSLTVAVNFLPLPASLGGQEASQAIVFGLFGLGSATGLAFSLILRILCLAGVLIGLLCLLDVELKLIRQKISGLGQKMENFFGRF